MIITGARLFDGQSDRIIEDAVILVEGERITHVGAAAEVDQPAAGDHIDARGLFVMPGLINMHEHLIFRAAVGPPAAALAKGPVDLAIHAVRVAAVALAQGITTVRDMGTKHEIALRIREAVQAGALPGPRILACNSALRVTGGHGYQAVQTDGADGFRSAARAQLAAGADFVKVMASHDPWPMAGAEPTRAEATVEEMRAAFDVAHDWGRFAACHVMGQIAIARALEAGVDIIDHGHFLTESLAEQMARRGIFMTPTLSAYNVQTSHPRFRRGPAWAEAHEVLKEGHAAAMRAAVGAGVRMVVGTDSVGCYAEEVDLLRRAGVSPVESLRACTSNAAAALRRNDIGVLEPGRLADLILLRGDPLSDPYALEQVERVIKGGRSYDPARLAYSDGLEPEVALMPLARAARD